MYYYCKIYGSLFLFWNFWFKSKDFKNNFGEEVYNFNNVIIFWEGYLDLGNKILKLIEFSKNKRIFDYGVMKFIIFMRFFWLFLLVVKFLVEVVKF